DHPMAGREQLDVGAEHLNRSEAAVNQDERGARPEDLIGELDAVHARDGGGAGGSAHHALNLQKHGGREITGGQEKSRSAQGAKRSAGAPYAYRAACLPTATSTSTLRALPRSVGTRAAGS